MKYLVIMGLLFSTTLAHAADYTLQTNANQEAVISWFANRMRSDCLQEDPKTPCTFNNGRVLMEVLKRWFEKAESDFLRERTARAARKYNQLTPEQKALFDAMTGEE